MPDSTADISALELSLEEEEATDSITPAVISGSLTLYPEETNSCW